MPDNTRNTGDHYEQQAAAYLQANGLKLLDSNHHSRHGEVDLIMMDKDTMVFIEVRYRRNKTFGGAAISVTPGKQKKIALTALQYLQRQGKSNTPSRFDVIAVTGQQPAVDMQWIKNAFESPLW